MFDNIGFVMLVGPGEGAMAIDSLEWALKLYPKTKAWVRDDATKDGTFEKLQQLAKFYPQRVVLQRNVAAEGYKGIAVSMFRMYSDIWRSEKATIEMLISLDPDACILRPGLVELARRKFVEHGPGMIGSYSLSPDGEPRRYGPFRRDILLDLLPIGIDKKSRKVRWGFPFYLKYLGQARAHGYRLGEHVLAALYVIHGDTFRELGRVGFWSSIPEQGSRYLKLDDPLISLGVKAIGHSLIDINDPHCGSIQAWLQYKGPLHHTAEEIWDREFLAVHPLKRDAASEEIRRRLRVLAQ
jgi:hypothetical protein